MKNLRIPGFLILSLVLVQFAQAQTVDEVINKHIEALGGKENLNKIQNIVMEGTLNYQGIDIGLVLTQVHNKLNRQDISVNGMTGFDMLTEKDGWSYMPFQGMPAPEPKEAADVKESQTDLDLTGPLVDYAVKGHKAELAGKEDVDGKACHKIKATLATGKEMTFFIDEASSMIVRIAEKRKINGQLTDLQTDMTDYKDVEGVKMAYSITQQYGTVLISSIKVNQTIPESAFKHDL